MFNKLCIIGPGLIGGSVARAARQHQLCTTITGYGRQIDSANLTQAKMLGVIDEFFIDDMASAVKQADCVVIATPVGAISTILKSLKPHWDSETLYTDVGSTKANILLAAEHIFGTVPENLVPAHPIAGAEQSGVAAAVADLFVSRRVIITPSASTNPSATERIKHFWQRLGAQVTSMNADHHDAILAATSHLPHLLAFALVDMLGHKDEQSEIFRYAAGGFKDFTRIASSDPTMWLDICTANKTKIIPLIEELKEELSKIQTLLENNAHQPLFETFTYAGKARQRFLDLYEN